MVIDDYLRLPRYDAQLLLDQNFGAEARCYPVVDGCRTLLGPGYALLRPEFASGRIDGREHRIPALRVLVTMGAADPYDTTSVVVEALADVDLPDIDVTVIVGAVNSRTSATRARAEKAGYRVLTDVRDMSQLMAEADIAISSAGTTLWELCCMGLPTITIVIAENQRPAAEALEQAGATLNLGWHQAVSGEDVRVAVTDLLTSQKARTRMGAAGQSLVDGRGVERVLDEMLMEAG
jgi:spore coat polysaccharide biosynthesis predicted glycosyltransferase SpsG